MSVPMAAKKEYHIAFDTNSTPGFIRAVKVTLETDMLPNDDFLPKAEQQAYDISLPTHPLYPALRKLCIANE